MDQLPNPRIDVKQSILPPAFLCNGPVRVLRSELEAPVITYDPAAPDDERWVLREDYKYFDRETGTWIKVPAGFAFDLASVPRALWSLIAPFELSVVAPLLHDWLYRHGGVPPRHTIRPYRTWTRAEADRLFRDAMEREGVPGWRRWAAYYAVRAFGGGSWRGYGPGSVNGVPAIAGVSSG